MKHLSNIIFTLMFLNVDCTLTVNFKALRSITKELARKFFEVSVISVGGRSDFIEFVVLKNFRDQNVAHSIVSLEDLNSPEYKGINTSAVIAFNSVESLNNFNNETFVYKKTEVQQRNDFEK